MKKKSISIYIILVFLISFFIWEKSMAKQTIEDDLPKQKVVLNCDRDFYLTGENIIFSANIFINKELDYDLSKVLYVEIYKNNTSITKAKYKVINGRVQGNIKIPEGLVSSNYYLRAYTLYMRNMGPETFYNKQLTIINPEGKIDSYAGKYLNPLNVVSQGDNLISNIANKGAVLFSNEFLKEIKQAYIIDKHYDSISNLRLYSNGLAEFNFIPEFSNNYSLKLILKNSDSILLKLNDVKPKVILSDFDYLNKYPVIVQYIIEINSPLKIFFVSPYQNIVDNKEIIVIDTITKVKFTNSNFPKGINYMIVANMENKILSIAPFYASDVVSDNNINIVCDYIFCTRNKVNVNLKGIKIDDEISINVSKAEPQTNTNPNTLAIELVYNPLLLNTDYETFDNNNSELRDQLFLSFMINKDEFYEIDFDEVLAKSNSNDNLILEKLPEIRDLSISGKVVNKENSEALVNQTVYATVLGENPQLHTYVTDSSGKFIFSLNQLQGVKDIGLSIDSIENVNAEIIVNNDFSTRFPKFIDYPVLADSSFSDFILSLYRNQQINYKFEKIIKSDELETDIIPFPFQNPQTSILLSDYIELATMQEVLNEIVTYVSARMNKGKIVLNVLNDRTETQYNKPLVLVDNLVIFDIDELMKLSPLKVK